MKKALVTGVTGQDGAYLADFLLKKGYKVYGTYRRLSTPNFWRMQSLGIYDKINLISADLLDPSSIIEAIKVSDPDEFYNLAAQSFVATSFEQPIHGAEITAIGVTRILEALRHLNPNIKFYQASTSEMYGNTTEVPQNENTPMKPTSPYATAKLYAHIITDVYRRGYDMFAIGGILFNHESPLRGIEFVTRKVSNAVAKIHLDLDKTVVLGNLKPKRDWGYAPEYVEAMWLMMQQDKPKDYVIATNESHSVEEFVNNAFNIVGLDWKKHVKTDSSFFRPLETYHLQGDYTKAKNELGWEPKINLEKLVEMMVKTDLERWKNWLDGKSIHWDAHNYPSEKNILTRMGNNERKTD